MRKIDIFDPAIIEISKHALTDEQACMEFLLPKAEIFSKKAEDIRQRAEKYVKTLRETPEIGIENFLQQYRLGTNEGITIMCLAEALIRIPDRKTANELIHDKLRTADWEQHLGKSKSLFVNASTWGMMLTGRLTRLQDIPQDTVGGVLGRMISRLGEPLVREALKKAMHIISDQFVIGRTIEEALERADEYQKKGYLLSYDMLGEAARSGQQAQIYYQSYINAVNKIGENVDKTKSLFERQGISVKLSALHPRYELLKQERVFEELVPRLKIIVKKAMDNNISVSIDAEESYRLDILVMVFSHILEDSDFADYDGIGFVLQAYQKRAFYILEHLLEICRKQKRKIPIRLVKGAYWDSEIKRAQQLGLRSYPVYTRKSNTDVSYLACAAKILEENGSFYPQFATHNVLTVASILEAAGGAKYEFQRLYGMGEMFYDQLVEKIPCRIYAPVGKHEELLPYLIRRLLENGANNSFVNIMLDREQPINKILADPIANVIRNEGNKNPATPAPPDLYHDRKNSLGYDLGNAVQIQYLKNSLEKFSGAQWECEPIIYGHKSKGEKSKAFSPFDTSREIGTVQFATEEDAKEAINVAHTAFEKWSQTLVSRRFSIIEDAADLLEENMSEAVALCMCEAGKTVGDAISEVREAVDYCRYYSAISRKNFEIPVTLSGSTGENNVLSYNGRGVFVCISPWNFPLAIFTGQVVAALLSGNTVIAKPAQQTSLIASFMVKLLHKAGIPENALQLLPGNGRTLGNALLEDVRIAGVAFTGSTDVAHTINRKLASREGPIVPLIAETGGLNAMIVDSSALPEQVVDDVIVSAFGSTGQRCSSLRVLYIQEDVADKFIALLAGAMQEIKIGNTTDFTVDCGPVIDETARNNLEEHIEKMKKEATFLANTPSPVPEIAAKGYFVAPHAFEIKTILQMEKEVFGPILHVIRYKAGEVDKVIDEINSTGYGLTFGVHSRIENKIDYIAQRVKAGNTYVNRSMIGAVVGVQPFGGEGLSGTGPKAGGPNYLLRFSTERAVSINTTAIGGNIALYS